MEHIAHFGVIGYSFLCQGVHELFKGEGGISRWGQECPKVAEGHVWMMAWQPKRAGFCQEFSGVRLRVKGLVESEARAGRRARGVGQ